ncbi:MAG: cytochrome c biogenesis protein CcsA [Myxococcales bacterium]
MATLTAVEILAYALASALYLGYLFNTRAAISRVARIALAVGVAAQFTDIGVRCFARQNPISSTPEAVGFVAFLIATVTLLAGRRYKLTAAGAFAAPAALALLVLARVVPAEAGGPRVGVLGMTHIFLATVGVAVFGLAAVLAVLYLVQERRLQHKRFDRAGQDAPLATLDRLALRCVSLGFPIFTVALVTGAIWIARLGGVASSEAARPEYLIAVAAWLAFGVLLVARVGAGWRGSRAAWLTLGGFGGTVVVLLFYILRYAV